MKKILIVLALVASAFGQSQTTVTGIVQDVTGIAATSGYVEFDLQPQNVGVQFFIQGTTVVAPQLAQCGIDGSGNVKNLALSGPCLLWGNNTISPANTAYTVIYAPNGNITNTVSGQCINGTTYDLSHPVFCGKVALNPQSAIIPVNAFNANVIPGIAHVFTVGSSNFPYATGYFDNLFLNGHALNPGAPNLSVQFNNNGVFTGDANLTWNPATQDFRINNAGENYFEVSPSFLAGNTPSSILNIGNGISYIYTGGFTTSFGSFTTLNGGADGVGATNTQNIVDQHLDCSNTNGSNCTGIISTSSIDASNGQNPFGGQRALGVVSTTTSIGIAGGLSLAFEANATCTGAGCAAHAFAVDAGDFSLASGVGVSGQPLISTGAKTAPDWGTVTGTGSFVKSTSPTLVTPTLGVATATSIAVGGGTALTTSNQTGTGNLVLANTPTLVAPVLGAATATSIVTSSSLSASTYATATNCASAGGTCGSASAGRVAIANPATTVTVSTTAVTANSEIFIQEDATIGTPLGVTCNSTLGRTYMVTTRTAGTSFVITASATPAANSACLSYRIVN